MSGAVRWRYTPKVSEGERQVQQHDDDRADPGRGAKEGRVGVARAAGLGLGPLEPFPLYAFYPDERLVASKLLWLLIAAVLVPLAAFMVYRPRWLLGDA